MQRLRNHALWSVLLIPIVGSGCSTLRANITGIAVENLGTVPPHDYLLAAFDGVQIDNQAIKKGFKPYEEITTPNILRVNVWEWKLTKVFNYQALLGPNFGSGATVTGVLNHSDPVFEVRSTGWLFAWGYWPFVRDRWVSAAATGTTIAIENYEPGKERVYFIKKMSTDPSAVVHVTCIATDKTITLNTEGTYIDIDVCGNDPIVGGEWVPTNPVTPIIALPAAVVTNFYDPATQAALSAGWAE